METFDSRLDEKLRIYLEDAKNIQIGTEAGFVTTYGIYPTSTDTRTLPSVLEQFQQDYSHYPKNLIADKGYGSTENYEDCENKEIEAYIKYPHWELEKKKRSKKYRYRWWNFEYDEEQDVFTCPENRILRYEYSKTRTRYGGRKEHLRVYTCSECVDCPAHDKCTRAEFKKMEFNPKRCHLQQKARARLKTDEGWQLYRKRGSEVEAVFGQVKGNLGFRRFNGWGNSNSSCEWGLLMMAYNLKNIAIAPRQ